MKARHPSAVFLTLLKPTFLDKHDNHVCPFFLPHLSNCYLTAPTIFIGVHRRWIWDKMVSFTFWDSLHECTRSNFLAPSTLPFSKCVCITLNVLSQTMRAAQRSDESPQGCTSLADHPWKLVKRHLAFVWPNVRWQGDRPGIDLAPQTLWDADCRGEAESPRQSLRHAAAAESSW